MYTLITGATSGIGYEIAKLFAGDKKDLILVARNYKKLQDIRAELEAGYDIEVVTLALDISIEENVQNIYDFVTKNNLPVENLVNNAGVGSFGDFSHIPLDIDLDMIRLNIVALTQLTKLMLPMMIKRGSGAILNLASMAAFQAGPRMSVYYATKAYVLSLSEGLSEELLGTGVKVSVICPGPVDTPFIEKAKIKKAGAAKNFVMTAEAVAKIGYEGFKKGKTLIIPGYKNKLLLQLLRIAPRRLVAKIIKRSNS